MAPIALLRNSKWFPKIEYDHISLKDLSKRGWLQEPSIQHAATDSNYHSHPRLQVQVGHQEMTESKRMHKEIKISPW